MKSRFLDVNGTWRDYYRWYPLPFTTPLGSRLVSVVPMTFDRKVVQGLQWRINGGESHWWTPFGPGPHLEKKAQWRAVLFNMWSDYEI